MVISFSSGANKQKYLVFVFVAAVLITFLILRQKPSQEIVLENFAQEAYNLNKNKININFEALNSSILQNLSSFEGFQVYPDAKGVPLSPSFSWGAATGAETYVFEIVGFFSTTTKNTFFNFSDDAEKLQPSKNYVWRVKACNNDMSYCSAWNSRSFATMNLLAWPKLNQPSISEVSIGRDNPFIAY
jgi:hypothetical protein